MFLLLNPFAGEIFIENHNYINLCLIGRDTSNWKSFILYVMLDIVSCSAMTHPPTHLSVDFGLLEMT